MAERKGARRPLWTLIAPPVLGIAVAVAILAADGETGLFPLLELRDSVAVASEEVAELERERDLLVERVRGLRSDPFEIEAAARAQGMVRPGEIVVRMRR